MGDSSVAAIGRPYDGRGMITLEKPPAVRREHGLASAARRARLAALLALCGSLLLLLAPIYLTSGRLGGSRFGSGVQMLTHHFRWNGTDPLNGLVIIQPNACTYFVDDGIHCSASALLPAWLTVVLVVLCFVLAGATALASWGRISAVFALASTATLVWYGVQAAVFSAGSEAWAAPWEPFSLTLQPAYWLVLICGPAIAVLTVTSARMRDRTEREYLDGR